MRVMLQGRGEAASGFGTEAADMSQDQPTSHSAAARQTLHQQSSFTILLPDRVVLIHAVFAPLHLANRSSSQLGVKDNVSIGRDAGASTSEMVTNNCLFVGRLTGFIVDEQVGVIHPNDLFLAIAIFALTKHQFAATTVLHSLDLMPLSYSLNPSSTPIAFGKQPSAGW
ncbi:uncharacterized protein Z519_00359 [Cladophialophora bantiana CBS 173.52]|uniref:Uncharacterized protein n=1 Tax=Cladophialophora bantiana (strain ATCC 10958 / CBS 173.52 / CDC B-1940 / NIH 8579) TaxID=1442370 RepID=A0A0D2HYZ6_CLAB1|nr:uncharacterized protein Z519_00359 [Cladophialophora bantiana CBS 173.52]KIW98698.1 hypothetical protein Z519_00359 [Cladophialophora bantiana CBS 173.52]